MGILGLTHDESGAAFEKLPVTIKVAIGEGPDPSNEKGHPRKLDHFVFKRKTLRGQEAVWVPAADIAQAYGDKPTEIGIVLLNDDPREVLRTEYAFWTTGMCKCHGELVQIANGHGIRFEMQAIRRTKDHPEGEPWPGNYKYLDGPQKGQPVEPCGDGCPDLERGNCKPSGDLYFLLEKYPVLGSICRLHTSSYRSIRNLSNGLMQIRRLNGGHLTGVKAILKATPESVSYAGADGTRHTSVAYILSLEIGARDLRTLVATMTEPVRLLGEGRAAFEASRGVQYVAREPETERSAEIAGEFYSSVDDRIASGAGADEIGEEADQLARICELARRLGYNDGKTKMLIGQWQRDLAGLERKLRNQIEDISQDATITNGKPLSNRRGGSACTPAPDSDGGPTNAGSQTGVTGFLY
jgi:hypothetical protein